MENGADRDLNESFNRQNFVKVGCVGNELSNTIEIIQYSVKMQWNKYENCKSYDSYCWSVKVLL